MKRKIYILLLLSLYIFSCTTPDKKGSDENNIDLRAYTKRTVKLLNNVGTLNIYLPKELDSLTSYIYYSDYRCGHKQIFEFSNRKGTILHQDGYVPRQRIDSTFYFKCEQYLYPNCNTKNSKIDSNILKNAKSYLFETRGYPIPFRGELLKIHNRDFAVWEYWYKGRWQLKDTTIPTCEVHAETVVRGNWLTMYFECTKKDTAGFMNKALTSLKTIEFDTTK